MQGYFYGWYFKCQSDTNTLAIIPAVHGAGRERTCSIQFITEDNTWVVEFKGSSYYRRGKKLCIEKNLFWEDGIRLKIETSEVKITGRLRFERLTPLKYDIMGPFTLLPFMECRHMVWSMCHRVNGKVCLNGQEYIFENALGYWEGDKGRSFPKEYAWTQCFFHDRMIGVSKTSDCASLPSDDGFILEGDGDLHQDKLDSLPLIEQGVSSISKINSIMLSVADIPLAGWHFTGMIGVVFWRGKEYRLATYLGAKVRRKSNGKLLIVQGKMELEVQLLKSCGQALRAPTNGMMQRNIYESAVCKAFYRFRINGETVFAFETDKASFEWQFL